MKTHGSIILWDSKFVIIVCIEVSSVTYYTKADKKYCKQTFLRDPLKNMPTQPFLSQADTDGATVRVWLCTCVCSKLVNNY